MGQQENISQDKHLLINSSCCPLQCRIAILEHCKSLAVLGYCKAAEAYLGGDTCTNGHTWVATGADANYNMLEECSVCGGERQTDAKVLTGNALYNLKETGKYAVVADVTTYNTNYNAEEHAFEQELVSCNNQEMNFAVLLPESYNVSITDYDYMVIYAKSNCNFRMHYRTNEQIDWVGQKAVDPKLRPPQSATGAEHPAADRRQPADPEPRRTGGDAAHRRDRPRGGGQLPDRRRAFRRLLLPLQRLHESGYRDLPQVRRQDPD